MCNSLIMLLLIKGLYQLILVLHSIGCYAQILNSKCLLQFYPSNIRTTEFSGVSVPVHFCGTLQASLPH